LVLMEKAKDLGKAIRNSSEFQELKKKEDILSQDPAAQEIIKNVQEVQQQLESAQRMGMPPEQEQMDKFENMRKEMHENNTLKELVTAQQDLNELMKEVNQAITDGIQEEEAGNTE